MKVKLKFEPRDLWIGVYWKTSKMDWLDQTLVVYKVYLCLLPTLPLVIAWDKLIEK